MIKIQRKLATKPLDTSNKNSDLVDDQGKKVFRLKNILPSGVIYIADLKDKAYKIEAGNEFDVTEEEFENLSEYHGFKEGYLIFSKTYKDHDGFSNCMSDDKISELIKLPVKKFEQIVETLNSYYVFQRICDALVATKRPSGYLTFVKFHEGNLKIEYLKSQEYKTDVEKNRELYTK